MPQHRLGLVNDDVSENARAEHSHFATDNQLQNPVVS